MIAYRRKTGQWLKPPLGSRIDWSHPLAQGLAGCFLLNEQNGSQVFDLVNRVSLPVLSGTTWSSGLLSDASARGVLTTAPAVLKLQPPLTLVWQGRKLGTPGNFAYLFGFNNNTNGTNSPFNTILLSYNSNASNVAYFESTNSVTNQTTNIAPMPSSGAAQFAIVVSQFDAGDINNYCFLNGAFIVSHLNAGTSLSYSSTSQISFGGYPTLNSNVAHDFGLIYGIAQTTGNLQWLAAEPYAYILPPSSTRYVFFAGGVHPWWNYCEPMMGSLGSEDGLVHV